LLRIHCFRIVLRFESKYPIGEMCHILGVSYSSYYKWKLRQQKPDRDLQLIELITDRYEKSKKSAGYRQLTLQLYTHHGLVVNHKAVYRIMKKLGIQSVARCRRRYVRYSDTIHRYENALNRNLKQSALIKSGLQILLIFRQNREPFIFLLSRIYIVASLLDIKWVRSKAYT